MATQVVAEGAADTTAKSDKGKNNKEAQKSAKLPPCAACKVLADSFTKVIMAVLYHTNFPIFRVPRLIEFENFDRNSRCIYIHAYAFY